MTMMRPKGEFLLPQDSLCYHECEQLTERVGIPHDPDARVVVSYGGDGTLLDLAHKYGNDRILLPLRHRPGAPYAYCGHHAPENVQWRLNEQRDASAQKGVPIWRLPRLRVIADGEVHQGLNEVCILNENRATAIRLCVENRNEDIWTSSVGDGVIVSSPYGSSGYFKSVANGTFRNGIGVAFVNDCEGNGWCVNNDDMIVVHIERGPAIMTIDNRSLGRINGKSVIVAMNGDPITVAGLDALFCNECLDSEGLPAGRRHV